MSTSDVLNLLALIVVPIAAVLIGQFLQVRAKKREDKMRVFQAMMDSRVLGLTPEVVRAANMIHVVFAKDMAVRGAWSEYYKALCVKEPTEAQLADCEERRDSMLRAMAASLGYADEVSRKALDARYVPAGMVDAMARAQRQQEYQERLLREVSERLANDQPLPKL